MDMVSRGPSLQRAALIAIVMHVVILMGAVWQMERPIKRLPMRLVVRTVTLPAPPPVSSVISPQERPSIQEEQPPQEAPAVHEAAAPKAQVKEHPPAKEVPVKEVRPVVKSEKKPHVTQAKKQEQVTEKKTVETKKSAPVLDKKLLKELQKELHDAKALDTQVPVSDQPNLALPELSQKTPVAFVGAKAEEEYILKLKQHLQDSLRLPDVGEVTVGLRLNAQGKVLGMEVLKKTSALNERYVLDHVPRLIFPAWGKGNEEKYFPVTLRSNVFQA